jgi:hypothetical protein
MIPDESLRKEVHKKIRKTFDDTGVVDFFYGGVLIDGTDISAFVSGIQDKTEYSNVGRTQRLIGIIQALNCQLCDEMNRNVYDESQQEDDGEI